MSDSHVALNPHATQPTSVASLFQSVWRNRQLIRQMSKREVVGRYKGSVLGLAWSFFNPIFMLIVYTFVFSEIFKARWGSSNGSGGKTEFAILLFAGMIVLNLVAEMLNRAPGLILSNVNYVKKVVFPLEILPVVAMVATIFHSLISLVVLMLAFLIFNGYINWTVLFLPIIFTPLVLLVVGVAWSLAALGVFIRDIGQTITVLTTVLMFISPVFYPVSALPAAYRPFIMANPLTFIIEQVRSVLVAGHMPDWSGLAIYMLVASVISWLGYLFFQRTRKGFADVL